MFENRFEIFGWLLAIIVVVAMGILVFTGPYHKVNKPQSASAPTEVVKIVTNPQTIGAYNPKTVTIKLGQSVKFTNVSNVAHTVTADNGAFDSGLIQNGGQTWILRPKSVGKFTYYCSVHPNMHGTLIVQS